MSSEGLVLADHLQPHPPGNRTSGSAACRVADLRQDGQHPREDSLLHQMKESFTRCRRAQSGRQHRRLLLGGTQGSAYSNWSYLVLALGVTGCGGPAGVMAPEGTCIQVLACRGGVVESECVGDDGGGDLEDELAQGQRNSSSQRARPVAR